MSYLMLSLFIVVGLLTILGLINPAWVRFTRLQTRESILGVGLGSLALLTIIHFLYYFLLSICVVVWLLGLLGLINPAWVQFTRLKTRGAILGVGIGITVLLVSIAAFFTPEEVMQEIIAKEAIEKARQDSIALVREQERIARARRDSIREVKEKARRDSIAFVRKQKKLEKARQDSIREVARQDSLANRPVELIVKGHGGHVYGKKLKKVDVVREGGPSTTANIRVYSTPGFTKSSHKTTMVNKAFNLFQRVYEDDSCSDIDEISVTVETDFQDHKGNEFIGVAARFVLPRVKDINYKRLSYNAPSILTLLKIEGSVKWYESYRFD